MSLTSIGWRTKGKLIKNNYILKKMAIKNYGKCMVNIYLEMLYF